METRSVLGVSALRPAFLDNVSAAGQAETCGTREACRGRIVIHLVTIAIRVDDDDEDLDDDEDDFADTDEDDDSDEDEEDDEDDVETWQVRTARADSR